MHPAAKSWSYDALVYVFTGLIFLLSAPKSFAQAQESPPDCDQNVLILDAKARSEIEATSPGFISKRRYSEHDFCRIVTLLQRFYPTARDGSKIHYYAYWDNPRLNANAGFQNGQYEINIYAGYLNYAAASPESLIVTACHEVGHVLGGIAETREDFNGNIINRSEKYSDYFAGSGCVQKFIAEGTFFPATQAKLQRIDRNCGKDQTCLKALNAFYSDRMTLLEASRSGDTYDFEMEDVPTGPSADPSEYPSPQCRLDTLIAAYFGRPIPKCTVGRK